MISLERITEDNYRECLNLKVADNQTDFVMSTLKSLALAYVYRDIVTPFVIYNDDIMVGFIMMRFYDDDKYYFLWEFMIDEKYQCKGYGEQALIQAIEWMKKDKRCKKIITTYIEGNERARKLYSKLGFKQMGEMEDGEVNMVLILSRS